MIRAIFNQKGGVGKSTISCNLAAISASRGKRTLILDLDPQGNTTRYLMGEVNTETTATITDYFGQMLTISYKPKEAEAFITATDFPHLDLMIANAELSELESKLESRYKMMKLRETLSELKDSYDAIYIDTPPALNFFSRSALIAANSCLIPFDCDEFSKQALYTLLDNIQEIKADHNSGLKIEGIIVNQFQPRAKLPRRVVNGLIDEGLPVLASYISSSVKIRESHEQAKPMINFDPKHKLSVEFEALYDEMESALEP